jgi:D-3-phosphoglycerate dehydrogenase
MMRVLITDVVDDACARILRSNGLRVDKKVGLSHAELVRIIPGYDGLIVRSGTNVTRRVIESGKKLRVIGRAGAGVDNIDVDAATRHGIIVMNTPGGNTISTAEHTLSLLFALARKIPEANASIKRGEWEREKFVGVELYGKTIGVIGLGKVGREVARRCLALGMTVIGYDPLLSHEVAMKLGVEHVPLNEVYRRSDFVTVHVPLTSDTQGMIGEREIKMCKPGVRIINCARGGIVDESAVLKGLESGQVAGVALDVFSEEPPGRLPILKHESVIATPHLGATTEEAQEKIATQIAMQVADALLERGFSGVVNAYALQQGLREEARPYVLLAEKLGSFHGQLMRGKLRGITISLSGSLFRQSQEIVTAAALKGILSQLMDEAINYVNAPVIAKEMGVVVNEKGEVEGGDFPNLLTLSCKTEREVHTLSGAVFGQKDIRIVRMDGFHLEAKPEGHLLLYSNIDRPGMLASVGSLLAQANINIAAVSLGRVEPGKEALTIMSTDSEIPRPVLKKIGRISGILNASVIRL